MLEIPGKDGINGAGLGAWDMTAEVVRILRREHANMTALLDTLEDELGAIEHDGHPDYDVIRGVINYFLSFPDIYHHPKENLIFERLEARDPDTAGAIGNLRTHHEQLSARARAYGEAIGAASGDASAPRHAFIGWGRAFLALQRDHIAMEERLLLPAAERAFTEADWQVVQAAMTDRDDPLLDESVGEHFDAVSARILGGRRRGEAE
jgi:hemerythrin-like domain-containing protein